MKRPTAARVSALGALAILSGIAPGQQVAGAALSDPAPDPGAGSGNVAGGMAIGALREDTAEIHPAVRQTMMDSYGLSAAQAELFIRRMRTAQDWVTEQEKDPTFSAMAAGVWLDPNGLSIHVATASAEVKSRVEAQRVPSWLVVHHVSHTLEELRKQSHIVRSAVSRRVTPDAKDLTLDGWYSRVDLASNSVEIEVPDDVPALAAAIRSEHAAIVRDAAPEGVAAGTPMVRLRNVAKAKRLTKSACDDQIKCGAPLRGGISGDWAGDGVPPADTVPDFTFGFIMIDTNTNEVFATSAGHGPSGVIGNRLNQWDVTVGPVLISASANSNADFSKIKIERNDLWKAKGVVYKPHTNQWPIQRVAVPGWTGAPICHTGQSSKRLKGRTESCGVIGSPFINGDGNTWDQGEFTLNGGGWGCVGDSGGAMEYDHRAFGLMQSVEFTEMTPVPERPGLTLGCGTHGAFTWASNITGRHPELKVLAG